MNTNHTPEPWFHYDDTQHRIHGHEIAATGKTVARIYCTKGDEAEDAANARLIAAAPDLLDAMNEIANANGGIHGTCVRDLQEIARAAIAKARGEG